VSRPPAVYRGNPFVIEAGLAYGKGPEQAQERQARKEIPLAEGEVAENDSELARVIRYANRVPLLYQQSACVCYKAVLDTTWRNYGVAQSRGAVPSGPMVIFVHMASVWVPFTSESKEAIAEYDEILGHESGPEGLPHSIIVTPEGTEGEAPLSPVSQNDTGGNGAGAVEAEVPAPEAKKSKAAERKSKSKAAKRKKR